MSTTTTTTRCMLATRRDAVPLHMGATPVEVRPDGSKVYEGIAAFGDVVAPYPDLVPPRSEFRPADEVMSAEALKSLEGLRFTGGLRRRDWDGKVTLPGDHTPELDDPDGNAIEGVVLRGWREDKPGEPPALRVRVIAHTRAMQDLVEGGTRGLSLGYVAEEDHTPGVHGGKAYQVVQRKHRYYHLAAVGDPRSKTPSGRGARLDGAPKSQSYSPHANAKANMKRKPTTLTPLAMLALAVMSNKPAPTGERFDAVVIPPDDAELIKQLSPEVQAAIAAAMGGAAALEADATEADVAGIEGETPEDELAEEDADLAQDATMLAPVLADIAAIKAALQAAGIQVAAPVADALPTGTPAPGTAPKMDGLVLDHLIRTPFPPGADGGPLMSALIAAGADAKVAETGVKNFLKALRKDTAPVTTPTTKPATLDATAIIAAATAAAVKRTDANAEFMQAVRKDGHAGDTVTEAATSMLTVIKSHLPILASTAEEAIKSERLDSLLPLYKQAEAIRRASIMDSQRTNLRAVMDASPDLGGGSLADLPVGDGYTRAPMPRA